MKSQSKDTAGDAKAWGKSVAGNARGAAMK